MAIEFLVEFRKRYRETLAREAAVTNSSADGAVVVCLERVRQSDMIRALDAELARRHAIPLPDARPSRGKRRKKKPSAVILPFPGRGGGAR